MYDSVYDTSSKRDGKFWTTLERYGILAHNFVTVPVTNIFLSVFSFDRNSKNVSIGYAAATLKTGSKALQQGKLFKVNFDVIMMKLGQLIDFDKSKDF